MRRPTVKVGDQVVHQSHPGRFTVTTVEPRPSMNVYSYIVTIRSEDGMQMKVLDTTVRTLPPVTASRTEE